MLSGLPSITQKFLLDINRLQQRSARAQEQITTGLKLTTVSDSPDDISRLLDTRSSTERVRQIQLNLGRVKVEVDTAEQALQSSVDLLDRARALATQGASGHQDANTRRQVAGELQGILERLVAVAATQVEGRYIFSGDADHLVPYELDSSAPAGVTSYLGSASSRQTADASGSLFAIAQTADIIFDSADPEQNVFLAVNGIRRALLAVDNPPNPPDPTIPTIEEALHNLGTAHTYLNQHLASYGLIQNRVSEATAAATKLELSLKAQLANIEEADLVEAAVELAQSRTALEAAFTARAQTPRRSLFDFLG